MVVGKMSSNKLSWIEIDTEVGYHTWLSTWQITKCRRPHYHPGYLLAMGMLDGLRPVVVVSEYSAGEFIYYAFYIQRLNDLPSFREHALSPFHLVSPYGYGGPIYEGDKSTKLEASKAFEQLFLQEIMIRGVVTEFVREDIFQEHLVVRTKGDQLYQQPNIVVPLGETEEYIWKNYDHKVRKNVNKARKNNLNVVFDKKVEMLDEFFNVYSSTMLRVNASSQFFIEKDRLRLMSKSLGRDGAMMYVHVLDGDDVVATELLLMSNEEIYSFLGGTVSASFNKRPNELLKHEVILWGMRNGFKSYILGGGVSAKDGIYKYKESFAPDSSYPFYVRRIVYNESLYKLLIHERRSYELANKNQWAPRQDFFPAYLS